MAEFEKNLTDMKKLYFTGVNPKLLPPYGRTDSLFFYQSLVSLEVLALYLLPPIIFCQFSTVSSFDIFISLPSALLLSSFHHLIPTAAAHIHGPETFIYETDSAEGRRTGLSYGLYNTNYLPVII